MALSYKKNSSDFMDVVMRELEVCVSDVLFLIVLLYIKVIDWLFLQCRTLIWRIKRSQLMMKKKREKQTDAVRVQWELKGCVVQITAAHQLSWRVYELVIGKKKPSMKPAETKLYLMCWINLCDLLNIQCIDCVC